MYLLYIDPGSGSLLFQVLLSALLTVSVFFKKVVGFFRYLLARIRTTHSPQAEEELSQCSRLFHIAILQGL
jgi:hypothetical protein